MWIEINLPTPPNRIRAYTHANAGAIFAVTESGFYVLRFDRPTWSFISERVMDAMLWDDELITYDPYGALIYRATYFPIHGFPTDDSEGCSDIPLGLHPPTGDRLDLDHSCDTLHVRDAQNSENCVLSVKCFGASEEAWATAGFSSDGLHLTVANLERILVFAYYNKMAEPSDPPKSSVGRDFES